MVAIYRLREHRVAVSAGFDVLALVSAYPTFAWLRLDGFAQQVAWDRTLAVGLLASAVFLVLAWRSQLHRGRAKLASLEEMVLLGSAMGGAGLGVFIVNLVTHWVPRSVPAGATVGALVAVAWTRAVWRRWRERDDERSRDSGSVRVLIVGAGEAGTELIGSMLRDQSHQWNPVALLDDDPRKRLLRIRGVPVVGTTAGDGRAGRPSSAPAPWYWPCPAPLPR